MKSTSKYNTGFALATKREIEAWNARIKVEKEAKERAKLERKFDHATRSF